LPYVPEKGESYFVRTKWPRLLLRTLSLCALAFVAFSAASSPERFHSDPEDWNRYNLADHSNEAFFGSVSRRPGMLLTAADLHLIQLRARRPVLLDGGQLDILPYVPETGPGIARILKTVYGVDFFNPPQQARRTATIPAHPVKEVWETRTAEEWMNIRKEHRVTEVLTYADWNLNLPLILRNKNFCLYAIPDRVSAKMNGKKIP
jgi:hypothetical protein